MIMKRKIYFALLSLCALSAFAGCQKTQIEEEPNPTAKDLVSFRVTALSPAEESAIVWEAVSDRIGVYLSESGSSERLLDNAYFGAYTSTSRSYFSPVSDKGKLYWNSVDKVDVGLYYPYRSSTSKPDSIFVQIPSRQTCDVASGLADIKKNTLFASAIKGVSRTEAGYVDAQLSPVASYVKVTITSNLPVQCLGITLQGDEGTALSFEKGNYNILSGELTSGETTSSAVEVTPTGTAVVNKKGLSLYAKVNPLYSGKKVTVSCSLDGAEIEPVTVDVPEGGFKRGVCTSYSLGFTANPINLSENGTANTYIVSKADKLYAFKATVRGNGNSTSGSQTFEGATLTEAPLPVNITPSDAVLVWYSAPLQDDGTYSQKSPVVTTSIFFDEGEGMVYFKTPKEFVNGNALIAVRNASGDILWSWNIWAVEGYDPEATGKAVGRYVVMDRNLGATAGLSAKDESDKVKAARAVGHYYQWGRKDPFPAAEKYTNELYGMDEHWGLVAYTDEKEYALSGNLVYGDRTQNAKMLASELGAKYSLSSAVAMSVKYPHKWMFGGTSDACAPTYDWFSGNSDVANRTIEENAAWKTLWGCSDNVTSEKTIYDPCPAGWKVPTPDFYAVALHNVRLSSGKHGFYLPDYDVYFPYAGQRKAGFGGSVIVGAGELLMSTAATSGPRFPLRATCTASSISSTRGGVTSYNTYAGAGYQVRCVKETVADNAPSYGNQSGHTAAFMGDSITRTWRDRGRASFFTENNYANFGLDGTTTINMVNRFSSEVLSDDPVVAVIAGGTNDLAWNDEYRTAPEEIVANVALMARMASDEGAKVIIGSVAPTRDMWWQKQAWKDQYNGDWVSQRVITTNALLRALAQKNGYGYADYWAVLHDEDNDLKEEYRWNGTDHVHPNAAAFLVMEGVLKPLIDAALYDPTETQPGGSGAEDMDKWEW